MTAVRIPRAEDGAVLACLRGDGSGADVVLVRGPHGVGRTTLLAAATREVASDTGRRIVVTTGTDLVGDLAAAVDVVLSDPPSPADAARIVAGLGRGVCDAVVVDDVQFADDRSARLLHHVVTGLRLPVVMTAPERVALPEPVEALRIADELSVVALPPFGIDEITLLAGAVLGRPLSSPAVRRLHAGSGGMPAAAVDLLSGWRRSGALAEHHGVWWLADAPLGAGERAELLRRGAERLAGGDAAAALAPLREAATAPPNDPGDAADAARALVLLAEAELLTAAEPSSARSLVAGPPSSAPGPVAGDRQLAAVWVAAARRPRDEAATLADGTAAALLAEGDVARARAAARLAWALAPAERRRDEVIALADEHDRIAELARAVAADDAAAAEALVDVLEAEGLLLDALWAADVATGLWLAHGAAREAAATAARGDHLIAQCRVLRVLHRRPDVPRAELSARETEIAELVAEGWSNREIASRLHLSVRTVEGHVLRICGKLGVRDRAGVGVALGGHGTPR